MISAFYHVWAEGAWEEPLSEYLEVLNSADFDGPLYVGIVGRFASRARVQNAIPRTAEYVFSPTGWEQVTLDAVLSYAQENEGAVMYAHTKGAYQQNDRQKEIRKVLLDRIVWDWHNNLSLLDENDAVGYQWTPRGEGYQSFFNGNWWMANCDYLRTLSPCSRLSRFRAEGWLGTGEPEVYDLSPEKVIYEPLQWEPIKDSDVCW